MGTGGNGIVHIAFHQSNFFQSLCQDLADFQMHFLVGNSRASDVESLSVASQYDVVDVFLATFKLSTDGNSTGVVGSIATDSFRTGVGQHHASFFQNQAMVVIVQRFYMLAEDDGE